ncbi:MAG: S41 family peptidase [Granulosicoccaceae bacterium]
MHSSPFSTFLHKLPTLHALFASAVLVSGCGAGVDRDNTIADGGTCELPDMRAWVSNGMHDYYLFNDQVPAVNVNDYADVETLIKDLRVKPFDRFSYVDDAQRSSAFFNEGKFFGFGWRLERTSDTDVQFKLINPGSPLSDHDVRRGDFLRAINSVSLNDISNEQLDEFLGTGDEATSPTLTIQRGTATPFDITVTKTEFNLQTVLKTDVIVDGNQRIGYLHFLSFIETSNAELDAAFDYFSSENINELVLDLRYNGGGRISVAGKLASQIGGNLVQDKIFARFQYNARYANDNQVYIHPAQNNTLDLSRVFVLTTDETCSASEMVINGLRPFVEVITVGGTSCGKPYGTNGVERCGKVMQALRVSFVNADGVGDYYDGINTDCPTNDNLNDTLGSPTEALFSSALEYIRTGSCSAIAYRAKPLAPKFDIINPAMLEKQGLLR